MITTIALADRLKEINNWSDYRLARQLEITPQTINGWRNKGKIMTDGSALKAAELLGLDEAFVLANIHAERAVNTPSFDALTQLTKLAKKGAKKPTNFKSAA